MFWNFKIVNLRKRLKYPKTYHIHFIENINIYTLGKQNIKKNTFLKHSDTQPFLHKNYERIYLHIKIQLH